MAVIFSVHQEQIDPNAWRTALQHICDTEQKGDTGAAIVCAQHRLGRIPGPRTIGGRPAIAVCKEKQPLLGARIETRDEIPQRQRVSSRSNMVPALHDDRVRPLAQKAIEPVAHPTMRFSSRYAWAEAHLRLDVPKRRSAI